MATQDLTLSIGAETGQATSALDELVNIMKELRGLQHLTLRSHQGLAESLAKTPVAPVKRVTDETAKQTSVVKVLQQHWQSLAGVIGGLGLRALFGGVVDAAADLRTLSSSLGVTTRGLQTLDFAADQAGVSVSAARSALQSLQGQLTGAALGDQSSMVNLGFLGLSRSALQQMDAPERFSAVADALARIEDPARRTGVAMRVFGGAAAELKPLLAKTPDELRELSKEFAELGGGISSAQIQALSDWESQIGRVKTSLLTLRAALAQTMLPILQTVAKAFGSVVKWLSDMQKQARIFEFGGIALLIAGMLKLVMVMRTMAAVDLFKTVLSLGKWIAIGAAIAAVAAIVQDLISMFRGGRSAIAEWIDEWKGLGAADRWVRNIKAGWEAMSKLEFPGIRDVLDAMRALFRSGDIDVKIEATEDAIKRMRAGLADGSLDPTKAAIALANYNAQLRELKEEKFGLQGLRTVGRGLASDVQRSGEMTTGSLSRFDGGPNQIRVENKIEVQAGAGTREIADGARRGVEQAQRETARQLQQAVGGKR